MLGVVELVGRAVEVLRRDTEALCWPSSRRREYHRLGRLVDAAVKTGLEGRLCSVERY